VFAPEYERVINIHGYDRIRRYYLEPGNYETDDEAGLAITRLTMKQSCWRRTLVTMKKMMMDFNIFFNIWGLVN
jgi:hypothetical protein